MANNVTNILKFDDALKDKILNAEGFVDFNVLVQMPATVYQGELGMDEFKKYGKNNWYDWRHANWGTKSNAYSQEVISENGVTYAKFDTAWRTPIEWLEKLSAYGDFTCVYADEALSHNCGVIEVVDGTPHIRSDSNGLTFDERHVLACYIKGYDRDEMVYHFGECPAMERLYERFYDILDGVLPDGFNY